MHDKVYETYAAFFSCLANDVLVSWVVGPLLERFCDAHKHMNPSVKQTRCPVSVSVYLGDLMETDDELSDTLEYFGYAKRVECEELIEDQKMYIGHLKQHQARTKLRGDANSAKRSRKHESEIAAVTSRYNEIAVCIT